MGVKRSFREEENSLGAYVTNSEENLIKGVGAAETINTEDTVTSGWEKKIHGQSGECQRKLIRIKLGNGYSKLI